MGRLVCKKGLVLFNISLLNLYFGYSLESPHIQKYVRWNIKYNVLAYFLTKGHILRKGFLLVKIMSLYIVYKNSLLY